MADIIIEPSVVPVWDRNTVADGKKMSESLTALSARDECLASYITSAQGDIEDKLRSVSSELHDEDVNLQNNIDAEAIEREHDDRELQQAIDAEADTREQEDKNLQEQIDKLNAATDVIAVFGTYDDFTAASAGAWQEQVTDNDVIKVLRDSAYNPPSTDPDFESFDDDYFQVYYQWHDADAEIPHTDWTGWSAIGNLDPYYSVAETNEIIDDLSATITANYYSAKNVKPGNNISAKYSTDGAPIVTLGLSSTILLDGVSSTNLSATNASGENLKYDYVTAVNLSSTNISANSLSATKLSANELSATKLSANELSATTLSASTAHGQSAKFDDISATNLTALTATGESAKYTNVSATNLTALSASGNLAQYITLSGQTIKGATSSINIDNLINSAVNGGALTGLKNLSGLYVNGTEVEFQGSADKLNLSVSGGATAWLGLKYEYTDTKNIAITGDLRDVLDNYLIKAWSGYTDSKFNGSARLAGLASDSEKLGGLNPSAYLFLSGFEHDADHNISSYNGSSFKAVSAIYADYAKTANSSYSSQSSQYAVNAGSAKTAYSSHSAASADNAAKLGGVEAAKYMVSTKLYSNTAGVITAYGNSDSKSALGCVGDYVEKSARNCTIGSANIIGTGAEDAFAQGCGNSAVDRAFVQGQFCVANYVSLAEGLNSSAISTAMAQGYNNSAYTNSLAQGTRNTAYNMSIAQGSGNSAYNTSQAFGQGLRVANTGMAIGKYNKTESAAFVIGNGTSSQRNDLFSIDHNGNVYVTGTTFSNLSGNVSSDYIVLPGITDAGGGRKSIAYDSTGLSAVSEGRGYRYEYSSTWLDILNVAQGAFVPLSARSCPIGANSNKALYDSLAQGYNASAENDSFAQGHTVYAIEESIAQGYGASAKYNSIAQGNNVTAWNQGQAFGSYAYAYGGFAVNPGIWGTGNVITSACNCGLALGNGCYASGNAVAIGYKTSSYDGFAWGQETRASGNSIAMGAYLNTKDRQIQLGWFGKDKSSDSNASVFSIGYGQSTADRSDILNVTRNGVLQLYNPSYPSTPVFQVDSNFMKSTLVNGTVIPLAMARGLPLTSTITASIFNVGVDHNAQNYYLFGSDNAYCNIWVPFRADNYATTFKLTKAASESIGTYRLAVGVQSGYTIIFKHFNSPSDNKTIISTGSNVTGAFPQGAGTSGYYDYDSFYMGASDKNTHIYFKAVPSDSEITFVIDNVSKMFSMIKGGWL